MPDPIQALQALQNLKQQNLDAYDPTDPNGARPDGMNEADLYRLASMPQQNMAPGAPAYWKDQLDKMQGQEAFKQKLSQQGEAANSMAQLQGFLGQTPQKVSDNKYTSVGPSMQPAAQMATAQRNADMAKAMMPLQEKQLEGQNQLAVENARTTGELNKQRLVNEGAQGKFEALQAFLAAHPELGNGSINAGGGVGFKGAQVPGGLAIPEGKSIAQLEKDNASYDNPGIVDGTGMALRNFLAQFSGGFLKTTDQQRALLKNQIAQKKQELGIRVPGNQSQETPPGPTPIQKPIPGVPGGIAQSIDGGKTWKRVQ